MKWIRSPSYDLAWLLAAPLVLVLPLPFFLTVQTAHQIAPIALAWSHKGYRGVMLENRWKFIGIPALTMFAGLAAAVLTWWLFPTFQPGRMILENLRLDQVIVPIVIWGNLYAAWNLYHGGAQNFGFLCLYLGKRFCGWTRYAVLGASIVIFVSLGHFGLMSAAVAGLLTTNHWLAAIGLSAHVYSRHRRVSPLWFVASVLVVGFALVVLFDFGLWYSTHLFILALCLSAALGIWHFLQDRWLWQFSNPQVRATIGKELFV